MKPPLFSVVVPTRNRRGLLARAIASVDAQRFRDFETIVVDDRSTDGTADWLRAERPDVALIALGDEDAGGSAAPTGASAARNRGIKRARGEFVAFLDDDDFWRPSFLDAHLALLGADARADLSYVGHIEVDAAGTVFRPDLRPHLRYATPLLHYASECPIHTMSVVACRRTLFDRIGYFDETLSIVQDLDLYLRLLAGGGRIAHSPALHVERTIPGGLVTRHRLWREEDGAAIARHLAAPSISDLQRRQVRASRALLFAKIALSKGDAAYAAARLAEALAAAPLDAAQIALVRAARAVAAGIFKPARPMEATP